MASLSSSTLASRIHLRPKLSRITTRSSPATRSASSTPSHQPPIRKRQSTHPPSRVPWRTQRLLFSSSSSSPLLLLPPNANHLVHYHHHHPSRRSLHHSSGFPQPMADLNRKLGETQPCFPVRGDEIQVLSEPQEFFQALLVSLSLLLLFISERDVYRAGEIESINTKDRCQGREGGGGCKGVVPRRSTT